MVNNKEKDCKDDKIKEKQEKDRKSAEKAEKAAKTVKLLEGSEELHYPTFTSSKPDGDLVRGGDRNLRMRFVRQPYLRIGTLGSLGTLARTGTGAPGGASSSGMMTAIGTCPPLGEESTSHMRILHLFRLHGGVAGPSSGTLPPGPLLWPSVHGSS